MNLAQWCSILLPTTYYSKFAPALIDTFEWQPRFMGNDMPYQTDTHTHIHKEKNKLKKNKLKRKRES